VGAPVPEIPEWCPLERLRAMRGKLKMADRVEGMIHSKYKWGDFISKRDLLLRALAVAVDDLQERVGELEGPYLSEETLEKLHGA